MKASSAQAVLHRAASLRCLCLHIDIVVLSIDELVVFVHCTTSLESSTLVQMEMIIILLNV